VRLVAGLRTRSGTDPSRFCILPLFQSEEGARGREADPRRVEPTATIQSLLRDILLGPPQFTDLDVLEHWIV
jgi:hypothetical protein